ncbi:c-type cytochrome [Tropicimonas sp. S265A]|uniref:c-type cytochrome n=1 Tax=Tropicimonas sp. S265A TaxID=3415134 RepID=UPI003C7C2A3A
MRCLTAAVAILLGTQVGAHEGVKNPAVMARMNDMKAIAGNMKIVGDMAKGTARFDATAARTAMGKVAEGAGRTPALFTPRQDDPKSEALPAIWDTFDDFTKEAGRLEAVATRFSETIETPEDLRSALSAVGETCKSCHETYRK